ncbi:hypothetical protein ACFOHO_27520, partial [Rhizorhabdus histidinilytica]|uniref:hypothetical protein n=1 Tax=Rhizorhabdus histidinilytica TaxID=439228 RepID=UPI0036202BC0
PSIRRQGEARHRRVLLIGSPPPIPLQGRPHGLAKLREIAPPLLRRARPPEIEAAASFLELPGTRPGRPAELGTNPVDSRTYPREIAPLTS